MALRYNSPRKLTLSPKKTLFDQCLAKSMVNHKAMAVAGQSLAESTKSLCCFHVRVGHTNENTLAKMTFKGRPIELE